MAHYQNDQQYPPYPPQPPHGHQQNPTPGGYDSNGAPSPYAANGLPYVEHTYGGVALPTRHGSSAARPDEFFAGHAPPAPPPRGHGGISGHPYTPQSPAVNQSGYNPQEYATPFTPTSMSAGAQRWPNAPASNVQYNPADYSDANLSLSGSAGGYQQGYSPAYPSPGQSSHVPSSPHYQTTGRPQSMHSNQRPTVQTSYSSYYTPPAPPPLPAIPGSAGDSPSDDWGRIPGGMNRYRSHRYQSAVSPPVLAPPHRHPQSSSYGSMDASYATSPDPPPPPPHAHAHAHGSATRLTPSELNARPLPQLPPHTSSDQGEYFSEHNSNNYLDSSVQNDLTHQIMNLSGATPSPRLDVCA